MEMDEYGINVRMWLMIGELWQLWYSFGLYGTGKNICLIIGIIGTGIESTDEGLVMI